MNLRLLYFVAVLLPVSLSGCGKTSNAVQVSGHVMRAGQPIANGLVTYFPPEGRPISASLSEAGDYQMDVPPGEYTVSIAVGNKPPAGWKEGQPLPPPKIVLPIQYTSRAKSTLKASVKPGQAEPINFDLK